MTFRLHPKAEEELEAESNYYSEIDQETVGNFLRAYDLALNYITESPKNCRKRGDHRRFNLSSFPFYLPYIVRNETTIIILAVAPNSRKPGYWKDRRLDS
jgi:hypothetical protein